MPKSPLSKFRILGIIEDILYVDTYICIYIYMYIYAYTAYIYPYLDSDAHSWFLLVESQNRRDSSESFNSGSGVGPWELRFQKLGQRFSGATKVGWFISWKNPSRSG